MENLREYPFSRQNFELIRNVVYQQTGIVLADSKLDMVYGRLAKRIRKTSLTGFDELCAEIERGNQEELDFLINAITTNLTAFFREPHHFEYLAATVIPELVQKNAHSKRIRIWSAGCSTGEEPYSIAMVLHENIPDIADWDIKILATDLDANVIETGERGVYCRERAETIPQQQFSTWFKKGTGANEGMIKVHPQLSKLITFKRLNLLHQWPMRGPFDVIFCRNVVIYFDKATQKQLFDRFADILVPNAPLFIGHSESLFNVSNKFIGLGQTIYRRL